MHIVMFSLNLLQLQLIAKQAAHHKKALILSGFFLAKGSHAMRLYL